MADLQTVIEALDELGLEGAMAEQKFLPILNCSVVVTGFLRWVANKPESEIIELIDGVTTKRVNRVLVAMDLPADWDDEEQPSSLFLHGAKVLFGRGAAGLKFQINAIGCERNIDSLVRTAIFYRDQFGWLRAEGDIVLIEAEIAAMRNGEFTVPDSRDVYKRRAVLDELAEETQNLKIGY